MGHDPNYRNITATVRTPRCAILINEASPYWKAAASGVIRQASEVWGGRYFLIIPTDGLRIKDKFWEVLEAYSPDHVSMYALSFSDMQGIDPALFAQTKQAHRERWDKAKFAGSFEEWFSDSAAMSDIDELVISEDLQKELINRLSPFHMGDRAVRHPVSYSSGFGYPFTKVSDIVSYANKKPTDIVLPKPIDNPTVALLTHSQTGIASPGYCEELIKQGLAVSNLPEDYDTAEFITSALGGRSMIPRKDTSDEYISRTPFSLSMLHLGQYYRLDRHHAEHRVDRGSDWRYC